MMKGTVTGVYKKLVKDEKIEMIKWKMKSWDMEGDGVKCTVTMKTDEDGACRLRVRVTGVPTKYGAETEGFWRMQVFRGMKIVLGYGGRGFF